MWVDKRTQADKPQIESALLRQFQQLYKARIYIKMDYLDIITHMSGRRISLTGSKAFHWYFPSYSIHDAFSTT
jgi:hypothetical protein